MKKILKRFFITLAIVVAIAIIGFTFWLRDRYVVPILMYHHVGSGESKRLALNTVSPSAFEYQMDFLKRNGYNVVSFNDWVEGAKKGYAFSRNTVVIQFDDGYEDNYTNAFPILQQRQLPAMVFLVSDAVGTPGFLTWDQVKKMEQYNVLAGSHTRHHKYLPDLSFEQAQDEIVGSKKVIEENLGHKIDYFVYPSGGFNQQARLLLKEAGYKAAATTNRGKDRFNHNLFEVNRIRIKSSDNQYGGFVFWVKLSGYYNLFRKVKATGTPWVKEDVILK